MNAVRFPDQVWENLLAVYQKDGVLLEGNLLKFVHPSTSPKYVEYLRTAIDTDRDRRTKRLEVMKQVQARNEELLDAKSELEKSQSDLREALEKAEKAREMEAAARIQAEEAKLEVEKAKGKVEKDLDFIQKRVQFQLMGNIVKVALWIVSGVGVTTTLMYALSLFWLTRTQDEASVALLGNTWSNMLGILLTNSFSIIGTIMGVKYATEKKGE